MRYAHYQRPDTDNKCSRAITTLFLHYNLCPSATSISFPITKYVAILNRPVCNVFRLFNIVRMCPLLHKRCITYTKVSRCCFIICLYFISQCFDQGSSHCEHYQYHYAPVHVCINPVICSILTLQVTWVR
jgi:hypothetical protein